jgi:hypothetical protein
MFEVSQDTNPDVVAENRLLLLGRDPKVLYLLSV